MLYTYILSCALIAFGLLTIGTILHCFVWLLLGPAAKRLPARPRT